MFTSMEAKESQMSFIFKVYSATDKSGCHRLLNSFRSSSFLNVVLAAKIFFRFPQASFGIFASRL